MHNYVVLSRGWWREHAYRLADMALHKTVLTELGNRHCIRFGKHFALPWRGESC